jgi:hypothetical protein
VQPGDFEKIRLMEITKKTVEEEIGPFWKKIRRSGDPHDVPWSPEKLYANI